MFTSRLWGAEADRNYLVEVVCAFFYCNYNATPPLFRNLGNVGTSLVHSEVTTTSNEYKYSSSSSSWSRMYEKSKQRFL
jgi:hypothetical protein